MARPPLPVGTTGQIRVYRLAQGYCARTLVRDVDGRVRAIERRRRSAAAARAALAAAVRDRHELGSDEEVSPDMRLSRLVSIWWSSVESSDRSPTTLRLYRDRIDRQVLPALGELTLREVTTGRLDAFLRRVMEVHGSGTAKATRSVLSGIFGLAVRQDALARNPVRDVSPIQTTGLRRAPRALTIIEVRQLRAMLSYDDQAQHRDVPDLVAAMLATGLRIGECCAICWCDVDLDAGAVAVRGSVVRVRGAGLTIRRSASSKLTERILLLPGWATEMFRRRANRSAGPAPVDPVFPAAQGGLRDPSNTQADMRDAFRKAGFDITSHVFRKTVATLMDDAGLSPRAGADQLGHSRPSMTADRYWGRRALSTHAASVLEALDI